MAEPSPITVIGDYTVLRLELQPLASFKQPAAHYLYLRRHEPKIPTPGDARTLFAVNVPIDATDSHFRSLFAGLGGGRVERVDFEDAKREERPRKSTEVAWTGKGKKRKRNEDVGSAKAAELPEIWDRVVHRSGSTAQIVFVDKASLEAALKGVKRRAGKSVRWGAGAGHGVPPLGSRRYLSHHRLRYPPRLPLQRSIDAFMTQYSALEAERAQQAARLRQVPDEDGFITVTRGGRTGPARQEDAQAAAEKQKSKQGLQDFYRFQTREARKKAQGELLRKFEEDRKRVAEMKRKRGKFRPD